MKKALIFGISGQDGSYLAQFLLNKGYSVFGASRDAQTTSFANLHKLGIFHNLKLLSSTVSDFRSVINIIDSVEPDEIDNLAGQSSVGLSFNQPAETLESICIASLNLLEAIRFIDTNIRFYSAGSVECFGDTGNIRANEHSPFRPRSPYAVAKAASFWQVANYREAYGLYACTGVLSNHESMLRPNRFVTSKIVSSACNIYNGLEHKLMLGNIGINRDWGWAPEYVDSMWRMLQQPVAKDFIVATGASHSLEYFIELVFQRLDLNWRDYVHIEDTLLRPTDIATSLIDPSEIKKSLQWTAKTLLPDLVDKLVESRLVSNKDPYF